MRLWIKCRRGCVIAAPCNYIKDGVCGADAKPCVIVDRGIGK